MNPLGFDFMQRALIAATVVCAVAPVVGTFIVQRRQSLVGDALGHVAFAGVGLALLLAVHPLVGALALALLAAVALVRLQRGGLSGDLSLALVFYGGLAIGFLLASRAGVGFASLLGFLFGTPLNLSWGEVAAIVVLSALVLGLVIALFGPLAAMAFDEEAAQVSGVPTGALVLALTALVALVVVGGMQAVGLLLIAAMMVAPVAAASQVAHSYRGTMAIAALIGAASAVTGLLIAFYGDYTPGASIVLTAIAAYVVTAGIRRLRLRRVAGTAA